MWVNKLLERFGLNKFVSGSTVKNVSTLMTGTALASMIPILTAPIMTRIFTTSDYGVLGLYMSITGVIGVIAYSHYSQAIMLAKEDDEAKQIIWLSLFLCGIVSLGTLLVVIVLKNFTSLVDDSAVGWWLFLVPVTIMLNGFNATLLIWANRVQQYNTLAKNRVFQALFTVVVQISLGLLLRNETGLMVGLLTGQVISVILLLRRFGKRSELSMGHPKPKMFSALLKSYKNLLFYSTPSEFINSVINQTPVFLLQKFGGVSYVGSYNFTQRLLGLPQQLISSAVVEVFKQKASKNYNEKGECRNVFVKTFKSLFALGLIPFGVLAIIAPWLFSFVFGEQWYEAGVFAQYLALLFFFRFVVSPLTYVYYIAGKQREDFILHILFLVLTTGAFYVGNYLFEEKQMMVLCYSIAYSFVYLIYLQRSYKFSKGNI